ncbi:hypothetical protein JCM11641_007767 [Rhodosporidiobolus odoratus]
MRLHHTGALLLAVLVAGVPAAQANHPDRLDLVHRNLHQGCTTFSRHPSPHLDRRAGTCSTTSDCANSIPANSNRYCKSGVCTFRCRTGYVQSGETCVSSAASSSTTTTTTTKPTTTTSSVAQAATSTQTCSATSDCTNTSPTNANSMITITSTSSASATTTTHLSSSSSLAVSPSSIVTCAARYTGGATTISGTGTLPKPTAFVTRSGQQLKLGSANYRIVGPNIYWLCSDENSVPWAAPPDKGRVREALAIAVAMGANTIRIHTCGISVGPNNPYNLEPSKGVYNSTLWDIRDYVLYAAREYGLRVILPLTDNWDYYHGGKYSFIDFAGLSRNEKGAKFYTAKAVIAAYQDYITTILTRVNSYTGIAYSNDPTILAWETGNELGGYINAEMWPPASWTNSIISTIREVDSRHLVIDGTAGFWNYTTGATPDGLNIAGVDMISDHGYPRNTGILNKEIALAKAAGKAFFISEYDWTSTGGGASLDSYLSTIESSGSYLGDMIWNGMGHDSQCCAFVPHSDGYSLYYPNGNSAADQANILKVIGHWYKVTGRTRPSVLPAVACPQPVF